MIQRVQRRNDSGGGGPFVVGGGTVAIPSRSVSCPWAVDVQVPNPEWDGVTQSERFITRNYNFGGSGNPGNVKLLDADGNSLQT